MAYISGGEVREGFDNRFYYNYENGVRTYDPDHEEELDWYYDDEYYEEVDEDELFFLESGA